MCSSVRIPSVDLLSIPMSFLLHSRLFSTLPYRSECCFLFSLVFHLGDQTQDPRYARWVLWCWAFPQPPHSSSRFHLSISLRLMWQFLSLEKENCQVSVRKPGKLRNQRFIFLAIYYFCLKYCLPWINLVTFIAMYNTYFIIYVWEVNLEFM